MSVTEIIIDILENRALVPQIRYKLVKRNADGQVIGACALGQIVTYDETYGTNILSLMPLPLQTTLVHLNDDAELTLQEIAEHLRLISGLE